MSKTLVTNYDKVEDQSVKDAYGSFNVYLSKYRYWLEDRHMEVVVWRNAKDQVVTIRVKDAGGTTRATYEKTPGQNNFTFFFHIPAIFNHDDTGTVEIEWKGTTITKPFIVKNFSYNTSTDHVPITIPNSDEVVATGVPFTVGVPFPRGAVYNTAHMKLVDSSDNEVPIQVNDVAMWSKHGSIKWIHLNFIASLTGVSREFKLQFGSGVSRNQGADIPVTTGSSFPSIQAGKIRLDQNGLWYDSNGDGTYDTKVLDAKGLRGGYVVRDHDTVNGTKYEMANNANYLVEEIGPEKIVLRRGNQPGQGSESWYENDNVAEEEKLFCQHITRYIIHRNSPLVRIFNTFIYTGDGNADGDRINHMGWEFDLATGFTNGGFLNNSNAWQAGDYLLQHRHNLAEINNGGSISQITGGRALGAAKASNGATSLYFGVKDFWQNYPGEIEFAGGSLNFQSWPKHHKAPTTTYPTSIDTAARLNLMTVKFAHEGVKIGNEVTKLSFKLPTEVIGVDETPTWYYNEMTSVSATERQWLPGEHDSVNAQGISHTDEMWLYIAPNASDSNSKKVLTALNDETVRAVVNPKWIYETEVFYEMYPKNAVKFPDEEAVYEQMALAPIRWTDKLGFYGKWVYGDIPGFNNMPIHDNDVYESLYRAVRSKHQGWSYSWGPYIRSGDSRFFKFADAATRRQIDSKYCHYVDEGVVGGVKDRMDALDPTTADTFKRHKGFSGMGILPWGGTLGINKNRTYESKVEFCYTSWYMTGYHRAKDYIEEFSREIKNQDNFYGGRWAIEVPPWTPGDSRQDQTVLETLLQLWEDLYDPWFLVTAYNIADQYVSEDHPAHAWRHGMRDMTQFNGDQAYKDYITGANFIKRDHFSFNNWHTINGTPTILDHEIAWKLEKATSSYHLKRVAAFIEEVKGSVWMGDNPEFAKGFYVRGGVDHKGTPITFTSFVLDRFPVALSTLSKVVSFDDIINEPLQLRWIEDNNRTKIWINKPNSGTKRIRLRPLIQTDATSPNTGTFYYELSQGNINGTWTPNTVITTNIDFSTTGVHSLEIWRNDPQGNSTQGLHYLVFPLIDDDNIGQVFGPQVGAGGKIAVMSHGQFFFKVPSGVSSFDVTVVTPGQNLHNRTSRIVIFDPDGKIATDNNGNPAERNNYVTNNNTLTTTITVPVPAEHRDKLWRIAVPYLMAQGQGPDTALLGGRHTVQFSTNIPPYFSHTKAGWFHP